MAQPQRLHRRGAHQRLTPGHAGRSVGPRRPRGGRPGGACTLPRRRRRRHHGTHDGHGPVRKGARGHVQLRARRAEGSRPLPRAVAAARARSHRRRDRRRLDRCRPAARDGLPPGLVLPALRRALRPARGDRSHDALPVQGRRELLDDPRRRQAGREQGLGLSGDPPGTPEITDRVAFYWDAVDHWYEEDEEVFVHPRDPYHRVDIVPSSRTVKISLDGVVLAESSRPMAVFETNLPTRWYLPKEDIAPYEATPRSTSCPYKGTASYWSVARQRGHRLELREPDPRRGRAARTSSRSTTRSSTSTSTASGRSAATRPSPRPGATHSDEHRTGDARGDARAPYRHRSRELPPRRP